MTDEHSSVSVKPPVLVTPVMENLGFVAISSVFWARDITERGFQRVRKLLSRVLTLIYHVGTVIDPLWGQRWGSEAQLQTHLWTGSCFPLQNHRAADVKVHSPAPGSGVWHRVFNLTLEEPICSKYNDWNSQDCEAKNHHDTYSKPLEHELWNEAFELSSADLDKSTPVFEDAQNLPPFNEINNAPTSVHTLNASRGRTQKPGSRKSLEKKTIRLNQETKVRIKQRKIFEKWNRLKAKRSAKSKTSKEEPESDQLSEYHEPGKMSTPILPEKAQDPVLINDSSVSQLNSLKANFPEDVVAAPPLIDLSIAPIVSPQIELSDMKDIPVDEQDEQGAQNDEAFDEDKEILSPMRKRMRLKQVFKRSSSSGRPQEN